MGYRVIEVLEDDGEEEQPLTPQQRRDRAADDAPQGDSMFTIKGTR